MFWGPAPKITKTSELFEAVPARTRLAVRAIPGILDVNVLECRASRSTRPSFWTRRSPNDLTLCSLCHAHTTRSSNSIQYFHSTTAVRSFVSSAV